MSELLTICSVNCRGAKAQMAKSVGVLIKAFKNGSTEVFCPFCKEKNKKKICTVNSTDFCVFAKEKD